MAPCPGEQQDLRDIVSLAFGHPGLARVDPFCSPGQGPRTQYGGKKGEWVVMKKPRANGSELTWVRQSHQEGAIAQHERKRVLPFG